MRRSKTAERLCGPTNTESCCISRNVGLSMMCYASGKAERICLGECQLSGRIICLINDCAEDHFISAANGNTIQLNANPGAAMQDDCARSLFAYQFVPVSAAPFTQSVLYTGSFQKGKNVAVQKHGLRYLHGAANREGACGLTIPDVQGLPIYSLLIYAYSTQKKTCGTDRWMQDNPYSLAVTDISRGIIPFWKEIQAIFSFKNLGFMLI